MRFLVAAKLYELGRISSGRAAELADMERTEFLSQLGRYRISVFNYSLEELEREIQEARAERDRVRESRLQHQPLILLAKIRRLDLLRRLYDEVLIPSGVPITSNALGNSSI
jgi:hypothetical protein